MKPEQIHLADWQRILIGNNPPAFLIEVFIRSLLILAAFGLVARLLGKRMNGQYTLTDRAVMLTLGAIVAPIMQLPDRGVFLGFLILACALLFQRGLTWLDFKSNRVEEITQGEESLLIQDGILQLEAMQKSRISKQQVYAVLRTHKIYNVRKVSRLYMEACGKFSVYTEEKNTDEDVEPNVSSLPKTDPEVYRLHPN